MVREMTVRWKTESPFRFVSRCGMLRLSWYQGDRGKVVTLTRYTGRRWIEVGKFGSLEDANRAAKRVAV